MVLLRTVVCCKHMMEVLAGERAKAMRDLQSDTLGLLPLSEVGNKRGGVEVGGLPHRRAGPRLHDHPLDVGGDDHGGGRDKIEVLAGVA